MQDPQCALCSMLCKRQRIFSCSGSTTDCQAVPSSVLLYRAAAAGNDWCLAVGAGSSVNGAKVQVGLSRGNSAQKVLLRQRAHQAITDRMLLLATAPGVAWLDTAL